MTSGFAAVRMHEAGRRMAERDGGMKHPDWKRFQGRVHKLGGRKGGVAEKDIDPNVGGGVDRDKLPDSDFAGPNRSFPIVTAGDVSDAFSSLGRAKDKSKIPGIRRNIIRIAKRKGFPLPDSAKGDGKKAEGVAEADPQWDELRGKWVCPEDGAEALYDDFMQRWYCPDHDGGGGDVTLDDLDYEEATEPFKGQPPALSRKFDDIVKAIKRTGGAEAAEAFEAAFRAAEDGVQNPYAVAWSTLKKMGWRKDAKTGRWSGPRRKQAEDAVTVVPATDAPSNVDRYLDSIAGKEAAAASALGQLLRPGPGMGRPKPVGEAAIPPEWAAWRVQRMQRAVDAANAYEAVPRMVARPSGPRDGYREAPPRPALATEVLPPHADRRARADPEVELWSGHKTPADDSPKTVPTAGPPRHDPGHPIGTLPLALMSHAPSVARSMIAKPGRAA